MHLVNDYIHPTPHGGRCRVRIFVSGEEGANVPARSVVIVTELANNPGQSVTNAIEWIAGEVLYSNRLDPAETVVIEHYEASPGARGTPEDSATFDLVTFSRRGRRVGVEAKWLDAGARTAGVEGARPPHGGGASRRAARLTPAEICDSHRNGAARHPRDDPPAPGGKLRQRSWLRYPPPTARPPEGPSPASPDGEHSKHRTQTAFL